MTRTAVLIDGNFFLKRARRLWGDTSPEKRASECHAYALRHIFAKRKMALEYDDRSLYRIFCKGPSRGTVSYIILEQAVYPRTCKTRIETSPPLNRADSRLKSNK